MLLNDNTKVYILLFTCAVTRAVHLELADDLTEEEFLFAFRRFVSRRSFPRVILSDNALTFQSASKTLRNYLSDNKVEWKFITPRAPWQGGFWERLIGITKQHLRKTCGKALLSRKELSTIITEVESIVNDKPMTYSSEDDSAPHPLSPSQLLCSYKLRHFPEVLENEDLFTPEFNNHSQLNKRFKYCNLVIHRFWERFYKEYLTALRERKSNINKIPNIGIGRIVLIENESLAKRSSWRLGLVTKIIESFDGVNRSVEVKTCSCSLVRPINKLVSLEIDSGDCNGIDSNSPVEEKLQKVNSI